MDAEKNNKDLEVPHTPGRSSLLGSAYASVKSFFTPDRSNKSPDVSPNPKQSFDPNISALGRVLASLSLDDSTVESDGSFKTTSSRLDDDSFQSMNETVYNTDAETTIIQDSTNGDSKAETRDHSLNNFALPTLITVGNNVVVASNGQHSLTEMSQVTTGNSSAKNSRLLDLTVNEPTPGTPSNSPVTLDTIFSVSRVLETPLLAKAGVSSVGDRTLTLDEEGKNRSDHFHVDTSPAVEFPSDKVGKDDDSEISVDLPPVPEDFEDLENESYDDACGEIYNTSATDGEDKTSDEEPVDGSFVQFKDSQALPDMGERSVSTNKSSLSVGSNASASTVDDTTFEFVDSCVIPLVIESNSPTKGQNSPSEFSSRVNDKNVLRSESIGEAASLSHGVVSNEVEVVAPIVPSRGRGPSSAKGENRVDKCSSEGKVLVQSAATAKNENILMERFLLDANNHTVELSTDSLKANTTHLDDGVPHVFADTPSYSSGYKGTYSSETGRPATVSTYCNDRLNNSESSSGDEANIKTPTGEVSPQERKVVNVDGINLNPILNESFVIEETVVNSKVYSQTPGTITDKISRVTPTKFNNISPKATSVQRIVYQPDTKVGGTVEKLENLGVENDSNGIVDESTLDSDSDSATSQTKDPVFIKLDGQLYSMTQQSEEMFLRQVVTAFLEGSTKEESASRKLYMSQIYEDLQEVSQFEGSVSEWIESKFRSIPKSYQELFLKVMVKNFFGYRAKAMEETRKSMLLNESEIPEDVIHIKLDGQDYTIIDEKVDKFLTNLEEQPSKTINFSLPEICSSMDPPSPDSWFIPNLCTVSPKNVSKLVKDGTLCFHLTASVSDQKIPEANLCSVVPENASSLVNDVSLCFDQLSTTCGNVSLGPDSKDLIDDACCTHVADRIKENDASSSSVVIATASISDQKKEDLSEMPLSPKIDLPVEQIPEANLCSVVPENASNLVNDVSLCFDQLSTTCDNHSLGIVSKDLIDDSGRKHVTDSIKEKVDVPYSINDASSSSVVIATTSISGQMKEDLSRMPQSPKIGLAVEKIPEANLCSVVSENSSNLVNDGIHCLDPHSYGHQSTENIYNDPIDTCTHVDPIIKEDLQHSKNEASSSEAITKASVSGEKKEDFNTMPLSPKIDLDVEPKQEVNLCSVVAENASKLVSDGTHCLDPHSYGHQSTENVYNDPIKKGEDLQHSKNEASSSEVVAKTSVPVEKKKDLSTTPRIDITINERLETIDESSNVSFVDEEIQSVIALLDAAVLDSETAVPDKQSIDENVASHTVSESLSLGPDKIIEEESSQTKNVYSNIVERSTLFQELHADSTNPLLLPNTHDSAKVMSEDTGHAELAKIDGIAFRFGKEISYNMNHSDVCSDDLIEEVLRTGDIVNSYVQSKLILADSQNGVESVSNTLGETPQSDATTTPTDDNSCLENDDVFQEENLSDDAKVIETMDMNENAKLDETAPSIEFSKVHEVTIDKKDVPLEELDESAFGGVTSKQPIASNSNQVSNKLYETSSLDCSQIQLATLNKETPQSEAVIATVTTSPKSDNTCLENDVEVLEEENLSVDTMGIKTMDIVANAKLDETTHSMQFSKVQEVVIDKKDVPIKCNETYMLEELDESAFGGVTSTKPIVSDSPQVSNNLNKTLSLNCSPIQLTTLNKETPQSEALINPDIATVFTSPKSDNICLENDVEVLQEENLSVDTMDIVANAKLDETTHSMQFSKFHEVAIDKKDVPIKGNDSCKLEELEESAFGSATSNQLIVSDSAKVSNNLNQISPLDCSPIQLATLNKETPQSEAVIINPVIATVTTLPKSDNTCLENDVEVLEEENLSVDAMGIKTMDIVENAKLDETTHSMQFSKVQEVAIDKRDVLIEELDESAFGGVTLKQPIASDSTQASNKLDETSSLDCSQIQLTTLNKETPQSEAVITNPVIATVTTSPKSDNTCLENDVEVLQEENLYVDAMGIKTIDIVANAKLDETTHSMQFSKFHEVAIDMKDVPIKGNDTYKLEELDESAFGRVTSTKPIVSDSAQVSNNLNQTLSLNCSPIQLTTLHKETPQSEALINPDIATVTNSPKSDNICLENDVEVLQEENLSVDAMGIKTMDIVENAWLDETTHSKEFSKVYEVAIDKKDVPIKGNDSYKLEELEESAFGSATSKQLIVSDNAQVSNNLNQTSSLDCSQIQLTTVNKETPQPEAVIINPVIATATTSPKSDNTCLENDVEVLEEENLSLDTMGIKTMDIVANAKLDETTHSMQFSKVQEMEIDKKDVLIEELDESAFGGVTSKQPIASDSTQASNKLDETSSLDCSQIQLTTLNKETPQSEAAFINPVIATVTTSPKSGNTCLENDVEVLEEENLSVDTMDIVANAKLDETTHSMQFSKFHEVAIDKKDVPIKCNETFMLEEVDKSVYGSVTSKQSIVCDSTQLPNLNKTSSHLIQRTSSNKCPQLETKFPNPVENAVEFGGRKPVAFYVLPTTDNVKCEEGESVSQGIVGESSKEEDGHTEDTVHLSCSGVAVETLPLLANEELTITCADLEEATDLLNGSTPLDCEDVLSSQTETSVDFTGQVGTSNPEHTSNTTSAIISPPNIRKELSEKCSTEKKQQGIFDAALNENIISASEISQILAINENVLHKAHNTASDIPISTFSDKALTDQLEALLSTSDNISDPLEDLKKENIVSNIEKGRKRLKVESSENLSRVSQASERTKVSRLGSDDKHLTEIKLPSNIDIKKKDCNNTFELKEFETTDLDLALKILKESESVQSNVTHENVFQFHGNSLQENWNSSITSATTPNKNKNMFSISRRSSGGVLQEIHDNVCETKNMGAWPSSNTKTFASDDKSRSLNFNAEDFDFLNSASKASVDLVPRESLYVKFDPLFASGAKTADTTIFVQALEEASAKTTNLESEQLINIGSPVATSVSVAKQCDEKFSKLRSEISRLKELYVERERETAEKENLIKQQTVDMANLLTELKTEIDKSRLQLEFLSHKQRSLDYARAVSKTITMEYESTLKVLANKVDKERTFFKNKIECLTAERDECVKHSDSTECAIVDVLTKFDKLRTFILEQRSSQVLLEKKLSELKAEAAFYDEQIAEKENSAAEELTEKQRQFEVDQENRASTIARAKAMIRKAELQKNTVQDSLDRKTLENQKLAAICDDLIDGKSPK